MGKTTLRIYGEETMRLLRRAKELMDSGMSASEAFGRAHDEIGNKGAHHHDWRGSHSQTQQRRRSRDDSGVELNEDRLYHWLVLDSPTVVREGFHGAIEYVKALRQTVRSERPDYVSPYEDLLPSGAR